MGGACPRVGKTPVGDSTGRRARLGGPARQQSEVPWAIPRGERALFDRGVADLGDHAPLTASVGTQNLCPSRR